MSATTAPISPHAFALALETLPLPSLYAKAAELRNSIAHLSRSNAELQSYSDSVGGGGDPDCQEAIVENLEVTRRMGERIEMLRAEVERRGARWHEGGRGGGGEGGDEGADGVGGEERLRPNGLVNGEAHGDDDDEVGGRQEMSQAPPRQSGRLTDEELQRRLVEQLGDDEEDGVHL
ncbi:MAG: hypothetical protein Q9160_006232 [Pyrenula sp. 1 TL-2023]